MISTRYKKLSGVHAGQIYVVTAPSSETDATVHWILHNEAAKDQSVIVSQDELADKKLWQPQTLA